MKKTLTKLIAVVIAALLILSISACASQEDIDGAVNPVSEKIEALEAKEEELTSELASLEETVNDVKAQADANKDAVDSLKDENEALKKQLEELQGQINCLNGKHSLKEAEYDADSDCHNGVCEFCDDEIKQSCQYGEEITNDNGTKSKTCKICEHTVTELIDVTIAVKDETALTMYYDSSKTNIDLSSLIDITEGAGTATYTLDSTTGQGSVDGSVLSIVLIGDYVITVTTAETDTHEAASLTFTVSITKNPSAGEFGGDWA